MEFKIQEKSISFHQEGHQDGGDKFSRSWNLNIKFFYNGEKNWFPALNEFYKAKRKTKIQSGKQKAWVM